MNREELERLLEDLDEALVASFPGPDTIRVLVVGGACLLLAGVSARPTHDVDVIITDLLGGGEASMVFELDQTIRKLRNQILAVGKRHGLRGNARLFLNDDCAPFLRELGAIPPTRLYWALRKLHLYLPADLSYILACKLIAGREQKDYEDIAVLRQVLKVETRAQAQRTVDRYFPDPVLQQTYGLHQTLDVLFGPRR